MLVGLFDFFLVELSGLGEIEFFGVGDDHKVAELLREAEGTNGVLEELGGAMEVGELGGFCGDGVVKVGELRAKAANEGLERGLDLWLAEYRSDAVIEGYIALHPPVRGAVVAGYHAVEVLTDAEGLGHVLRR
ncbi:hypothetical protein JHK84_047976 [Glycine max]|nr:hypothetical protein JHK86_047949 [Glycine max]KAG4943912.1 hypothetical protein JHK85_048558 [Glycine max]KAG5103007.1 hypothetical protein JHK84_047976 [Glycine max]